MPKTFTGAFIRNFLGNAPGWYKLAIIAFLIANPVLLYTAGPFITGCVLIRRVYLYPGHGAEVLSIASRRSMHDVVGQPGLEPCHWSFWKGEYNTSIFHYGRHI